MPFNGNWTIEGPLITNQSILHGVDPFFMGGIRYAENGRPGLQFGVETPGNDTYDKQLQVSCATIRNCVKDYLMILYTQRSFSYGIRLCYSPQFIEYVQKKYAPLKVANDPNNLNKNWIKNVTEGYNNFCEKGKIE